MPPAFLLPLNGQLPPESFASLLHWVPLGVATQLFNYRKMKNTNQEQLTECRRDAGVEGVGGEAEGGEGIIGGGKHQ